MQQALNIATNDSIVPTRVKLSTLIELFQLGETPIPGYEGGDQERLRDQDRFFCLGQIKERYADRSHERGVKSWIRADQKIYRQLKPIFAQWVRRIDALTALLTPYAPDYDPWNGGYGGCRIADLLLELGEVGLVEWDLEAQVASTPAVINFIYSNHSLCDTPVLLARRAFEAGRLDILKATEQIRSEYISPTAYWLEQIQNHAGTNHLHWIDLSQYEIIRNLHPTIALLAALEIPSNVAGLLHQMGLTLNPDGTEEHGCYNHQNIFTQRYSMQRFAQDLASAIVNIRLTTAESENLRYSDVMEHRDFIDWHKLMLHRISETKLRSIYELFGIDWAVIEDILQTLPDVWWIALGVNPKCPPTAKVLRQLYLQRMKQVHPDNGGTTADAQRLNEAYEIARNQIHEQANAAFNRRRLS